MRNALVYIFVIIVLLGCQHKTAKDLVIASDDVTDIAKLRDDLANAQQRVLDLEAQLIRIQQELERALLALDNANERIRVLEAVIADGQMTISSAKDNEQQLEAARVAAAESRQEVRGLEKQNQALKSQQTILEERIERAALERSALEARLNQDASSSVQSLLKDTSTEPTLVEVFYGTNRAPQELSKRAYFTPFILPLILCLVWLLTAPVVKKIIKTKLQFIIQRTVRLSLGIVIVALSLIGLQSVSLKRQSDQTSTLQYGPDRLVQPPGEESSYHLGTVTVSIPPTHKAGEVEKPQLLYLEFIADPAEHFVLQNVTKLDGDLFYQKLRERVVGSPNNDLFVFVHGFHNTFEDAAFRTAQISHDIGFEGAPMFFSWPSQGNVQGYTVDENNVKAAVKDLTDFLVNIKANSQAKKIHLIAHSMGNRALTNAIKDIGLESDQNPQFNEVILAAPDMDAQTLRNITSELTNVSSRVTLYASSRDKALALSRKIHGGQYPRAGESAPLLVMKPMESIDVSEVSGSHSYISDSGSVLGDLKALIMNSRPVNTSAATPVLTEGGQQYWVLRRSSE